MSSAAITASVTDVTILVPGYLLPIVPALSTRAGLDRCPQPEVCMTEDNESLASEAELDATVAAE